MSSLLAVALPFILALLMTVPGHVRHTVCRVAPLAPLVLLPVLLLPGELELGLQLVGLRLGTDAASTPLVWLTLIAWGLAGWLAAETIERERTWFWSGWLLALTGMNLALLAGNIVSFYLGFALVSLSAYLLVVQAGTPAAWRAGRIYLVMAMAGEAAILAGVLLLAGKVGNVPFDALLAGGSAEALAEGPVRWLLLIGFAVKLGIIPVHLWLPLAHPVAPVPASAILSGVIVKAGLLGWLRFVPALEGDPAVLGQWMLAIGLVTAFGGVLLGLTQTRIKTVLAYSTISQMGLILCGFSVWFLDPAGREGGVTVLGLLALHHGLNKAALFLACACQPGASRWRLTLFVLPALSLAGLPLTTGFLAKGELKDALTLAGAGDGAMLLVALSSTATALLMWKAFSLARAMNASESGVHPAWPLLVLAALVVPWLHGASAGLLAWPDVAKLLDSTWPLILAVVLILAARRLFAGRQVELPEGDAVVLVGRVCTRLALLGRSAADAGALFSGWRVDFAPTRALLARLEDSEARLPMVGLALLAISVLLWLLTGAGGG
ncbi:complex I subunit 5 family protein [Halorhodospira sp. 9621]|uniref:complex I subunit 5 family protein n=1 Tax=Halorhodospira sp. 9621 TaxID=2899135 RepID=UPI001EE7B622|nr:complex I subunit 5 family protein [Halorhodospira sp. 9621]MCG5534160.1 complex I subunit 5 family protein [Halorhodospira sp. 9621]